MVAPSHRKGSSRVAGIPAEILDALERGELQTGTLAECLAVDQARLCRKVFPELPPTALAQIDAARSLGILKRMGAIGSILLEHLGLDGVARCQHHGSDTVRGWACFMVGAQPRLDLRLRLEAIRPRADDAHFGVREWAWMAVRPHLARDLAAGIASLTDWTTSPSERLRRFASEALRPRGVWCTHIAPLKQHPEQALPVLEPLKADPSTYVQDSVANWLNDAGKDRPDWVSALCRNWLHGDPSPATQRICIRAMRNLK